MQSDRQLQDRERQNNRNGSAEDDLRINRPKMKHTRGMCRHAVSKMPEVSVTLLWLSWSTS